MAAGGWGDIRRFYGASMGKFELISFFGRDYYLGDTVCERLHAFHQVLKHIRHQTVEIKVGRLSPE